MITKQNHIQEYLQNKEQIDKYLKSSELNLRQCIDDIVLGDEKAFYYHMNNYINITPPKIYTEIHKIISNYLKQIYKTVEMIEIYKITGNTEKINNSLLKIVNLLQNVIGGFYALIKMIFVCKENISYIDVIKEKYPKMDINISFSDITN